MRDFVTRDGRPLTPLPVPPVDDLVELTTKEEEALKLAGDGLTLKEIGYVLRIHPNTAKNRLNRVKRKLGVAHLPKRELVVVAREWFAR